MKIFVKPLITFVSAVVAVDAAFGQDRESAHPGSRMRILETSDADDKGDLDFYIEQSYRFDVIPLTDDFPFINCNCTESEETTCAARLGFFKVMNECQSSSTVTTDEDNNLNFTFYNDDNCSPNETQPSNYTLPLDQCFGRGEFKIAQLSNWCIHSPSGPAEPFVVPMIQPKTYEDLAACESDLYPSNPGFIPVDDTLCLHTAFPSFERSTSVASFPPGSVRTFCNAEGSGQVTVQRFADRSCSIPFVDENGPATSTVWSPSSCAPFEHIGSLGGRYATADCNAATIYCKSLLVDDADKVSFATRVAGNSKGDGSGDTDGNGSGTGENSTGNGENSSAGGTSGEAGASRMLWMLVLVGGTTALV